MRVQLEAVRVPFLERYGERVVARAPVRLRDGYSAKRRRVAELGYQGGRVRCDQRRQQPGEAAHGIVALRIVQRPYARVDLKAGELVQAEYVNVVEL